MYPAVAPLTYSHLYYANYHRPIYYPGFMPRDYLGYNPYPYEALPGHAPYPFLPTTFIQPSAVEQEEAIQRSSLPHAGIKDQGGKPYVVNIEEVTKQNMTYRTALWTGKHLQVTLMSIDVNDDIGLEVHPTTDQFIRIEEGQALVKMGDRKDKLDFEVKASDDFAIMIPAGKWHNVINTGSKPLKVYAIYAPPEHPFGTVHKTKAEAMAYGEQH